MAVGWVTSRRFWACSCVMLTLLVAISFGIYRSQGNTVAVSGSVDDVARSDESDSLQVDLASQAQTATTISGLQETNSLSASDVNAAESDYETHLRFLLDSDARQTRLQMHTSIGAKYGGAVDESKSIPDLISGSPWVKTKSADLDPASFLYLNAGQNDLDKVRNSGGVAHIQCAFSHFSYDDPIINPGEPGAAHLHMFLGNTHTNAYSTGDSILNSGDSTCNHGALNRTSYWLPAMLDGNNNALVPSYAHIYYERYNRASTVGEYPTGLQYVSLNPAATTAQSDTLTWFACGWAGSLKAGQGRQVRKSSTIPDCTGSGADHLTMEIRLSHCWDGERLEFDPADPNVTNGPNGWYGACGGNHPVELPTIWMRVAFPLEAGTTGSGQWYLSSDVDHETSEIKYGRGISSHADWFNGWHKETFRKILDGCINNEGRYCEVAHVGNGDRTPIPWHDYKGDFTSNSKIRYSPDDVLSTCPHRSDYDGSRASVAYCLGTHDH